MLATLVLNLLSVAEPSWSAPPATVSGAGTRGAVPAQYVPTELSSEATAVLKRFRMAVVLVETQDPSGRVSEGTGFFTSPDGELVTNYHVMQLAATNPRARVRFILGDGTIVRNFSVGRCEGGAKDLCLLKLPLYPEKHFRTKQALPGQGDPVFLIGNPKGAGFTVAGGYFRGAPFHENVSEVEVSIGLVGGMSGGPIITGTGNLVGVATRTLQRVLTAVPKHLQPEAKQNIGISAREVDRFQEKIEKFVQPEQYFSRPVEGG